MRFYYDNTICICLFILSEIFVSFTYPLYVEIHAFIVSDLQLFSSKIVRYEVNRLLLLKPKLTGLPSLASFKSKDEKT